MNDAINPHLETLLGRKLLGTASDRELIELEKARAEFPTLNEAIALLDDAYPAFQRSVMASQYSTAELPDYLRPQSIARQMQEDERRFWRRYPLWVVLVLFFPAFSVFLELWDNGNPVWWPLIVGGIVVGIAMPLMIGYQRRQAKRVALGGTQWRRAARFIQRWDAFVESPRCRSISRLLFISGILLIVSAIALTIAFKNEISEMGFDADSVRFFSIFIGILMCCVPKSFSREFQRHTASKRNQSKGQ